VAGRRRRDGGCGAERLRHDLIDAARAAFALLLITLGACTVSDESGDSQDPPLPSPADARALPDSIGADDGQWTMPGRDYAGTRFSGLSDIDRGNVKDLDVAWTFSTGNPRGHEAAPIVVGGTMYLISPFPNKLYALDLTKPGAPVKWTYEPPYERAAKGVACCDLVNRGTTYADGRLYFVTLDNQAIAVDAESGKEAWRVKVGDIQIGETMTMAPLVVKGKVLIGDSGGEFGVRGWVAALDASSGDVLWKAYHTGPDADILIGSEFRPFYAEDREPDLGVKSWPPEAWKQGGGTVWGWITYDPETDLVFYGTANPGPWNPDLRPGDNKWTAAVFARSLETGQARWAYQWSPHDLFDHDGVNENVLVDLQWKGQPRKVLLHAERNGYVYVMDRGTGEILSADPFVHITSSKGVDLSTGRLIHAEEKTPRTGAVVRDICPASPGAKDWQPTAYSPFTGLLYIPHNNLCMDWESAEVGYIAGTPYIGANVRYYPGPGGNQGVFTAWDPIGRHPVWSVKETLPVWSGALVTAGNIVFYGTMDGWFKALDATTGETLWSFKAGSGIVGQPVTYRGPDGKQYVAVFSGVGGWPGVVVNAQLDTLDPTAAAGWGEAMRPLVRSTTAGSTLYVFALP
jgi:lanthanide-dependent methanol dehydrogenase